MKMKYALTLRPKFALWFFAAVLGTTWYAADPQARPDSVMSPGAHPGAGLLSAHPAAADGQRVVSRAP